MEHDAEGTAARGDMQRRAELAAFLRAHRESINPGDIGLPDTPRRRTPGLRREEVAHRASVSASWYTWLEQGRAVDASLAVIDALAGALTLTNDEHAHLRRLAGLAPHLATPTTEKAHTRWCRFVEEWAPNPAVIANHFFDYLVWNESFERLYMDDGNLPVDRRNIVLAMFHDSARQQMTDWADQARSVVARFRYEAGKHPGAERFEEIARCLSAESEEFRAWWSSQVVETFTGGPREISVKGVGPIQIDFVHALLSSDPDVHAVLGYPVALEDRIRLHQLLGVRYPS